MRASLLVLVSGLAGLLLASAQSQSCIGVAPALGQSVACDVAGETSTIPLPANAGYLTFSAIGGGGGRGGGSSGSYGGAAGSLTGQLWVPAGATQLLVTVAAPGVKGGNTGLGGGTGGTGGNATYVAFANAAGAVIADAVIAGGGGGGGYVLPPNRRELSSLERRLTDSIPPGGNGVTSSTNLDGTQGGNWSINAAANYGGQGGSSTDPLAVAQGGIFVTTSSS